MMSEELTPEKMEKLTKLIYEKVVDEITDRVVKRLEEKGYFLFDGEK